MPEAECDQAARPFTCALAQVDSLCRSLTAVRGPCGLAVGGRGVGGWG